MDAIFVFLLIVHVGAVVAWLGGGALFISVISPALKGVSQSTRAEVLVSVLPKYVRYLGGSSILSILAGLALYGYSSATTKSSTPFLSGTMYIDVGALLGLVAFVIVFAVVIPAARRIVNACKKIGDSTQVSETPRLLKRMRMGATITVGILAIVLILMMIGANV